MSPSSRASSTRQSPSSGGYTAPPPMSYARSTRREKVTKRAPKPKPKHLMEDRNAPLNILHTNITSPLPLPMFPWLNPPLRSLFTEDYSRQGFPAARLRSPQAETPDFSQYISLRTSTPAPDAGIGLRMLCGMVCENFCVKPEERRRLLEGHERRKYGTL